MTQFDLYRRSLMKAAPLATAALGGLIGSAQAQPTPPKAPVYAPKPMPFDPQKVKGMSEKILLSHYNNNYVGAVKRLNSIADQLASLDWEKAPVYVINGLKREELVATNSMILHEAYFAGLGEANLPGKALTESITDSFGSMDRWRSEFAATGRALGGGSGWVTLSYNAREKRLINSWAADHTMTLAGGTPILVLDMFEHAYQMDFGAKAADYVSTIMAAVNWSNADQAFSRASKG